MATGEIRNRSESLWRIIRSLSPNTYNKLLTAITITGKNAQVLQLLHYYRSTEEYSRQDELKRYPQHEALKKLKLRAMNLVVDTLGTLKAFPRAELSQLMDNVEALLAIGTFWEAMIYIEKAKEVAYKLQAFRELRILLDKELECATQFLHANDLLSRVEKIEAEIAEINESLLEIETWTQIATRFELPARAQSQFIGSVSTILLTKWKDHLGNIRVSDFKTLYANAHFHESWVNLLLHSKSDNSAFLEHAKSILLLFENHQTFMLGNPLLVAKTLLRIIAFTAEADNQDAARQALGQMLWIKESDDTAGALIIHEVILAHFMLAWQFRDVVSGKSACSLLEANRLILRNRIKPVSFLWLQYFAACFYFDLGSYKDAKTMIDASFRMEEIKIDLLVNLKVIRLMSIYLEGGDVSGFGVAAKATEKYVEAKSIGGYSVQKRVINALQTMHQQRHEFHHSFETWKATLEDLKNEKSLEINKITFERFNFLYYWERLRPESQ